MVVVVVVVSVVVVVCCFHRGVSSTGCCCGELPLGLGTKIRLRCVVSVQKCNRSFHSFCKMILSDLITIFKSFSGVLL